MPLLLVAMPCATSSFWLLVEMPGAASRNALVARVEMPGAASRNGLVASSDALCY